MKLLLGGALTLIPVVGVVWPTGYAFAYARRVLRDRADRRLPEWTDWHAYFRDGLTAWTIAAIWQAPGLILLAIALPYVAVAGIDWLGIAVTGTAGALRLPALIWTALALIFLTLGLMVLPASLLLFALTGSYGDAFRPRDLLRICAVDRRGYLAVWWQCCLTVLITVFLTIFPPTLPILLIAGPWVSFHLTLVWAILWADWAAEKGLACPT